MNGEIIKFLRECYADYLPSICKRIEEFPEKYVYPDGNPVKPVLPIQTTQNTIMLVGAFPSAKFERRNGLLVPVADNLSPFGEEIYFDGKEIRTQASRESLNQNYFPQLKIDPQKLWITDLVKVYLFPKKHIKNCEIIAPNLNFVNTHKLFEKVAVASLEWMKREIKLSNPKLIITLGEVPARIISGDKRTNNKQLLDGSIRNLKLEKEYRIAHLAHPEIRRLNKEWHEITRIAIKNLSKDSVFTQKF